METPYPRVMADIVAYDAIRAGWPIGKYRANAAHDARRERLLQADTMRGMSIVIELLTIWPT